jgi:small conductance mechanosensitive channel
VLAPLLVAVLLVYSYRRELFGPEWNTPVRFATTVALIILGWQVARDVGRSLGPLLLRRLEPATAGTVGFLIRLVTMLAAVVVALRVADLEPRTLALSGALGVVIVGLAAQQTLGNLFAGTVLVSARPFKVGERVRLQGGPLAGTVEGVVTSQGLLYTILASGEDAIMVPNSVVLNVAVVPLREPQGVDLRARLRPGVTPLDVEQRLREQIETEMRGGPRVTLEELDGDEVVVRVGATPRRPSEGARLATEVLEAIASLTAHGET